MSVSLNWNRQGTGPEPRYVAGVIKDGKIAVLRDNDFMDTLAAAWRQFATAIVPLNSDRGISGIRCYFNFSAGGMTIEPLNTNTSRGRGSVYLVTGNFVEVWSRAAPLDRDEGVFRRSIEQQQRFYAELVLRAAQTAADDLAAVAGAVILFTAVGTPRVCKAALGQSQIEDHSPGSNVQTTSAGEIQWKKISDSPGNIIYCGRAESPVGATQFTTGIQRMWQLMDSELVPLNSRPSWDHVRCEFEMHSGCAVVFVARAPFEKRIEEGSCRLELPNFQEAWKRFEDSGDSKILRDEQMHWAKGIVAAAGRIRLSHLEGAKIQFWYDEDLLWTTTLKSGGQ